jgi:valyl-tRNA synthetase
MIFSGLKFMKEEPFEYVLIHGLVRDSEGKKMSKSSDNGIDPLEVIAEFGADALRFSLSNGISPGADMKVNKEKIENSRNFMNKIWNAARFVILNMENAEIKPVDTIELNSADKWILAKLNKIVEKVTGNLTKFDIGLAASTLYDFVWSDYCDWYIELCKPALYGGDEKKKSEALSVLSHVLTAILKLLHPFTPFITEEIYSFLHKGESLMMSEWPVTNKKYNPSKKDGDFEDIMEIIKSVRNIRAEMKVIPSKKVNMYILSSCDKFIKENEVYILKLANAEAITYIGDKTLLPSEKMSSTVCGIAEIFIPLGDLVDIDKEKERLAKEIEGYNKEIERGERMLGNAAFVAKAPESLVEEEKAKLEKNKQAKEKLAERLNSL